MRVYNTIDEINAELRRIQPIKAIHRNMARWGNVEHRERYNRMLDYERELKREKAELKKVSDHNSDM